MTVLPLAVLSGWALWAFAVPGPKADGRTRRTVAPMHAVSRVRAGLSLDRLLPGANLEADSAKGTGQVRATPRRGASRRARP